MVSLGDSFPGNLREQFSKRNIKVGSVLRLHVTDTIPPKVKIFIVIGQNIEGFSLATIYVNSNLNFNIHFTQDLRDLQIDISPLEYDFLNHDSVVDCSKLHYKDRLELENIVTGRPEAHVANLSDEQVRFFRDIIKGATTIKGKIKKKYGFYD